MARYQTATAAADPVRPYLEGVAESLVERLYGAGGPARGTKLSAIEDTIKAARLVPPEKMLAEALRRQANTAAHRPADFGRCPKCGQEARRDPEADECRALQTDVGEARWQGPATCRRECRRSFFPSGRGLGD